MHSKNLRVKCQRSRSPHDQIWQKYIFWATTPFKYTRKQPLPMKKTFGERLSISENLMPNSPGQHMTKYRQNTIFWAMTESDTHYKGGFWRPICDKDILSQPVGGGISLTLKH